MKESTFWKLFCAGLVGFAAAVLCLQIQAEPIEPGKDLDWFNSHPHNFVAIF